MSRKRERVIPDVILIDFSKLKLALHNYERLKALKHNWTTPFGIALSLLLTILVSDFKEKMGLAGQRWETIIYFALLISIGWLIYSVYSTLKNNPMEVLLDEIAEGIKNIPEYTAIFLVKVKKNNIPIVLVERNKSWDAYFLPYAHYSPNEPIDRQGEDSLRKVMAGFLGVCESTLCLERLKDFRLVSEKFSESEKMVKQFHFEFFTTYFSGPELDCFFEDEFDIGGKKFVWKTLDELEADENTVSRNGDVIDHLRKHYSILFHKIRDTAI